MYEFDTYRELYFIECIQMYSLPQEKLETLEA